MNRVRIATITCALIGAFLWGCGEQESLTVVQIGIRAITAEDIRSYVLGLNESQRSHQEGRQRGASTFNPSSTTTSCGWKPKPSVWIPRPQSSAN